MKEIYPLKSLSTVKKKAPWARAIIKHSINHYFIAFSSRDEADHFLRVNPVFYKKVF